MIQDIEKVIAKLRESQSISILMVEQYLEFAWRLADRYFIMARGSIVARGKTEDLSHDAVQEHLVI